MIKTILIVCVVGLAAYGLIYIGYRIGKYMGRDEAIEDMENMDFE